MLIGNSMGGCQSIGKGFWYVPPAGQDSSFQLKFQPVGKFINNRAHSCYDGVFGETDTGVKSEQLFPKVDGDNTKKNLVAQFDGFTAFRIRNRGIWMRPVWFVFENARVATSREGVSLVTSGGLDGNAPGVWGLLKDSTVVGVSKNNVDRWGPCGNQNQQEGPGCVDWNSQSNTIFDKGYASPAWNFAGFYIYDGPVRIHDVRFVNYKIDPKPLLTDGRRRRSWARSTSGSPGARPCTRATPRSAGSRTTRAPTRWPRRCKGLKWDNVDLRHQVFTDQVNFGNFDDGDKNTAIIDRDGTLTGFAIVDAGGKTWDPVTNPTSTAQSSSRSRSTTCRSTRRPTPSTNATRWARRTRFPSRGGPRRSSRRPTTARWSSRRSCCPTGECHCRRRRA